MAGIQSLAKPAKAMNASDRMPAVTNVIGAPRNATGTSACATRSRSACEQRQREPEAERRTGAVEQRRDEAAARRRIDQRDAEHGAVRRDERNIEAEHALQQRREAPDRELRDADGRADDEQQREQAQILELVRPQHVAVDELRQRRPRSSARAPSPSPCRSRPRRVASRR